jgi:hypothetical protein
MFLYAGDPWQPVQVQALTRPTSASPSANTGAAQHKLASKTQTDNKRDPDPVCITARIGFFIFLKLLELSENRGKTAARRGPKNTIDALQNEPHKRQPDHS